MNGIKDRVRNGCGIKSPSYMDAGSSPSSYEDLERLRVYLAQRYDASSLMHEARCAYGNEYIAEYGMRNAIRSFLLCIRDRMGLDIASSDIGRISDAVLVHGDISYRGRRYVAIHVIGRHRIARRGRRIRPSAGGS